MRPPNKKKKRGEKLGSDSIKDRIWRVGKSSLTPTHVRKNLDTICSLSRRTMPIRILNS